MVSTVSFAVFGGLYFSVIIAKPYKVAFGLIVGVGYLVAQTFTMAINPNFPRPVLHGPIHALYFIVCTLIASIILTLWRQRRSTPAPDDPSTGRWGWGRRTVA